MRQVFKFFLGITILGFIALTSFTKKPEGCKIMHSGTFTYGDAAFGIKVVIKGVNHIEYHENGKYIIKSKLNWLSDCEYDMTMTEITIPGFPYKVGDVMNVKINRVDGNEIYYTSTVQGNTWDGKFIKVKK
jgi:hypothetical protein